MPPPSSFLVARVDNHLYVRAIGLANMKSAPMLDAFLRSERAVGALAMTACIDLSACSGMDSTFMGLLVGSAESFASAGGRLVVVNPSQGNLKLLETLGVTAVVAVVSACEAPGVEYTALHAATTGSPAERIQVVRRAHQHLMALSSANRVKFGSFVEALESDLARQATLRSAQVPERANPAPSTSDQMNADKRVSDDVQKVIETNRVESLGQPTTPENDQKPVEIAAISTVIQDTPEVVEDGGLTKL